MAGEKKTAKKAKTTAAAPKSAKAPAKSAKRPKGTSVRGVSGETSPRGGITMKRPTGPSGKPRIARLYEQSVRPALMEKFGYGSPMQAPRFLKIVLNMGVGDALLDAKLLDAAMNELGQISGQRPSARRAKKSISNFKLREGVAVGCSVTLRGSRMYEFYDRLISVAVPRIRDFRGLSPRSFDGQGNYSMGLTEQIIFPEINYDKVAKVRGLNVTIVTSARNDEEGRELLKLMNMPFRQR
jgi:large subunit ribosomal protein L5